MTEEQANFITTRIFPHIIVSSSGCWEWRNCRTCLRELNKKYKREAREAREV